MKRRISQAEAERSIPGRGRVTQTRPTYSLGSILVVCLLRAWELIRPAPASSPLFSEGAAEEINLDNLLEALPGSGPGDRMPVSGAESRRASAVLQSVPDTRAHRASAKRAYQLGYDKLSIDCTIDHRGFSAIFANCGRQPFKPLPGCQIVWQQVSRISQRHSSIALQLPPDFHPLAGPLCRQRRRSAAAREHRVCLAMSFLYNVISIT